MLVRDQLVLALQSERLGIFRKGTTHMRYLLALQGKFGQEGLGQGV